MQIAPWYLHLTPYFGSHRDPIICILQLIFFKYPPALVYLPRRRRRRLRHAVLVVRERRLRRRLRSPRLPLMARNSCYPDEHDFPTPLGMADPAVAARRTIAGVDRTGSVGEHPAQVPPQLVASNHGRPHKFSRMQVSAGLRTTSARPWPSPTPSSSGTGALLCTTEV
jgi:hypothetical protein